MKKKMIKIVIPIIVGILLVMLFFCCGKLMSPSLDVIAEPAITTSTTVTTNTTTTTTITTTIAAASTISTIESKQETTKTTEFNQGTVTTESITETTAVTANNVTQQPIEEYMIYKPDTHYVHRSNCHWAAIGHIERIENTEGIEARKCSECNPEIEIVKEYIEPVSETIINNSVNNNDRELLAQIVWHEAGSDWIGIYDKAMVVAGVMNRVNDNRFPSTVYDVLIQPGQFTGFWPGTCTPTQSCYDAVDYYFNNIDSFGNHNSWYGVNGQYNVFYYQ